MFFGLSVPPFFDIRIVCRGPSSFRGALGNAFPNTGMISSVRRHRDESDERVIDELFEEELDNLLRGDDAFPGQIKRLGCRCFQDEAYSVLKRQRSRQKSIGVTLSMSYRGSVRSALQYQELLAGVARLVRRSLWCSGLSRRVFVGRHL